MPRISIILLSLALVFCLSLPVQAHQPFPDTGQTRCYGQTSPMPCPEPGKPFFGQDPQFPRIPRSYAKLGQNGTELPADAAHVDVDGPWIMTRDNVTGLIWENKTSDSSEAVYSFEDAKTLARRMSLGGYSDWRIPTIKELASLVMINCRNGDEHFDKSLFPNLQHASEYSRYWSSTAWSQQTYPERAWLLSFFNAVIGSHGQNAAHHVLAVRGRSAPSSFFKDNQNDTVTDATTGLVWMKCPTGQALEDARCSDLAAKMTWEEALAHVQSLDFAGYTDWRLPNRNELLTLVDYSRSGPALDPHFYATGIAEFNAGYWTSTTSWWSGYRGNVVDFWLGEVGSGTGDKGPFNTHFVRAVRGGNTMVFGSLRVAIAPAEAVAKGGWRRLGGDWRDHDELESSLPAGRYIVEFKEIPGWTKPGDLMVAVEENRTTKVTGTYEQGRGPKGVKVMVLLNE